MERERVRCEMENMESEGLRAATREHEKELSRLAQEREDLLRREEEMKSDMKELEKTLIETQKEQKNR